MKINKLGLDIIKTSESLSLKAYRCPSKVLTIGYGTTIYPNGKKVGEFDCTTVELAESFLQHHCSSIEKVIIELVEADLNENQFSALVSLVYNIGQGAFSKSTLLKKLNSGDYEEAANQFLEWRKSGKKILKGLEIRRAKEKELFELQITT